MTAGKKTPSKPYVTLSDNLFVVPVERHKLPHAEELRRAMAAISPELVAVQLPRQMQDQIASLIEQLPKVQVLTWRMETGETLMLPVEPVDPMMEACRTADEFGIPINFFDDAAGDGDEDYTPLPDGEASRLLGARDFYTLNFPVNQGRQPTERDRRLAYRLAHLAAHPKRTLVVMDIHRLPVVAGLLEKGLLPPGDDEPTAVESWRILEIGIRDLSKVMHEIPYIAWLYENFRSAHGPEDTFPYHQALKEMLVESGELYFIDYDERINMTEWQTMQQYARNLAVISGRLRPVLDDLVIASKGVTNDDFAAILFETMMEYPPNQDFDEDQLFQSSKPDNTPHLYSKWDDEVVRLMPAYAEPEGRMETYTFNRRNIPSPQERESWRSSFGVDVWLGGGICSWPPEDMFIEDFFRSVRSRAYQQISEGQSTIEEFSTSLLDGIDMRETMRNWHKKKLYVKRDRTPAGKVGPVVVLWHDKPVLSDTMWHTCLYAENQNESDIAFFSTKPGKEMVGPGISRIDYYGILSVFPARGIPDIWRMPNHLRRWRTENRCLIAAAILLSQERFIAVLAPKPPDLELRTFARENGRALVYLPLSTFGKPLLNKARRCHILAGKNVRQWGKDYIPER